MQLTSSWVDPVATILYSLPWSVSLSALIIFVMSPQKLLKASCLPLGRSAHTGFSVRAQFIILILPQPFIWWFTPRSQNMPAFFQIVSPGREVSACTPMHLQVSHSTSDEYWILLRIWRRLVKWISGPTPPIGHRLPHRCSILPGSEYVQSSSFLVGPAWSQLHTALRELVL